jgi:pilus assembly protein CpaB
LLIGAIGFGIFAAVLSVVYLKAREAQIKRELAGPEQEFMTVVVANADIQRGTQVSQGSFATREVPAEYVHNDAIFPNAFEGVRQRYLTKDLEAGKPLLASFLDEEFPLDFSDTLEHGRRAITISVDDESSQASMIRPGNRVDLYVNVPTRESGLLAPAPTADAAAVGQFEAPDWMNIAERVLRLPPTDIIMPVAQDILVLATGTDVYEESLDTLGLQQNRSERRYTTLTIDVSPEDAALIRIAEDKGTLLAMLRNREDRSRATFIGKTAQDLFTVAANMAAQGQMLAAQGLSINEKGEYIDADGNVVDPAQVVLRTADGRFVDGNGNPVSADDVVVLPDGTITTKERVLAQQGFTRNANGQLVDSSGNVVDEDDVVIMPDGTAKSKQQLLAEQGFTRNANGEYVDANGNVVSPDDVVALPDGTVTTKQQLLADAGFTLNENGQYVDADGNVVDPDDVKVLPNGTVMTSDGRVLAGPQVTVNEQGFIVAEDGTVMTPDGKVLTGMRVDENGNVIAPDGKRYNARDLVVNADGTVSTRTGEPIAGVGGSTGAAALAQLAQAAAADQLSAQAVDLIIGGASTDGVAKITALPITE